MLLLQCVEYADAPDHEIPLNLVRVERFADTAEQHDRQLAAEVLAKLVEAAKHGGRMIGRVEMPAQFWSGDR